jgi:ubiquinone/menaquinone biosynthesis C-methylase UbiE
MNAFASTVPATPDFTAIKQKQQATWASGDYAVVGTTLQIVGEQLAEAIDVLAGERVLDVAAGNGNATLAAARRFAEVTSTDYVGSLLDKASARAQAEGLRNVQFQVADVEDLPYPDASFDLVLSTFGVMFAPNHARSAQEMLRVVRPGGRIGLANWTPDSFIGRLFKIIGKHVAPPAGVQSPALWGSEAHLRTLFGDAVDLRCEKKHFNFRFRSPAHWVQVFREFYGPTHKAFGALQPEGQKALEQDILTLIGEFNRAAPSMVVPSEYLEIVATKR